MPEVAVERVDGDRWPDLPTGPPVPTSVGEISIGKLEEGRGAIAAAAPLNGGSGPIALGLPRLTVHRRKERLKRQISKNDYFHDTLPNL